jgi:histidine kinase
MVARPVFAFTLAEAGRSVPVAPKAQLHGRGAPYNYAMTVARFDLSTRTRAPSPADIPRAASTLYLLWVVFWLLMIVIALQDQLRHPAVRWWEPLLWEGSSAAAATFWFVLQRRAGGRYTQFLSQPLSWFGHHLKWLPVVAVGFIVAVYGFRHGAYALLGFTYVHESWPHVFIYEAIKLSLFVGLWLGIIFGFDSFTQWQAQRRQLAELQETLSQAQLAQLKAQLRPHFLFNALNTVSALMHADVARADRLLARLGDLLRASLRAGEQEFTTLA